MSDPQEATNNVSLAGSGQRLAVGLILVAWVVALISIFIVLPGMLLAAYDGESFEWLNRKIAAHAALAEIEGLPTRDRQWYSDSAERYSYRLAMFATVGAAVALLLAFYRSVASVVTRYVWSPDYAFNLGVMRAVVYSLLLYLVLNDPIAKVAALPPELRQWPALARWALAPFPIGPGYVAIAMPLAIVACCLAVVGWKTRWTTSIALTLSYSLIGIATLTGKVNRSHHIIIIALIVALSRSGDAFSLDSLLRRLRDKSVGPIEASKHVAYGLPLRLITVFLGIIYFFPGFWKAAVGPSWVFGDALSNITRNIWFQREYFEPLIRVDLLGPLIIPGALGTIVFEMGFLPAMFFKWSRVAFAVIGVAFHTMIKLTMGISFWTLQAMYVAFVDFYSLGRWLGGRLGTAPLTLHYDTESPESCRIANLLIELDWLHQLRPVDRRTPTSDDPRHAESQSLLVLSRTDRESDATLGGVAAWRAACSRLPLLWPAWPLVYLLPGVATVVGALLWRLLPKSGGQESKDPRQEIDLRWNRAPILVVFLLLSVGFVGTGFARLINAWPIACYPTFDSTGSTYTDWPTFWVTTESGRRYELDDDPIRDEFSQSRYVVVLRRFITRNDDRAALVKLLGELAVIWERTGDIDPDDPPESIEVLIGRYALTGPRRPA